MTSAPESGPDAHDLKQKFIAEKGVRKLPDADLRGGGHERLRREIMAFHMDDIVCRDPLS